jgi:hypothetical protein
VRFAAGHLERRRRRVDPDDVLPFGSELACERARAAANVEHDMRTELIHQSGVCRQIGPTGVDGVVDRSEPRLLEDRIRHSTSLATNQLALERLDLQRKPRPPSAASRQHRPP